MKDSEGLSVIVRDLETNPKCQHGPTILFSSRNRKFFACSTDRSKNCFFMELDRFERHKKEIMTTAPIETIKPQSTIDLRKCPADTRYFCVTCDIVTVSKHKSHEMKHISDKMLKEPSLFLPQLSNDKINAQYFFDDTTLNFMNSICDDLKLNSTICLGTPRLHDFMRNKSKESILLDIDSRFEPFYPDEFCSYNMFNNYFFKGLGDEQKLVRFLTDSTTDERTHHCLFVDPPFAARTELLSETLSSISRLYHKLNRKVLPIFWIFPYFNEHHVIKSMPQMEMMDYHVTYMNHYAFNDVYKGRKEGSVVRLFTNVPLDLIKYPTNLTNYRFCDTCCKFVSRNNLHCLICNSCPSKNGSTYRHCHMCQKCVKPNYLHCGTCGRCTQKSHDCKTFQQHQTCWLCQEKGHVEKYCGSKAKRKQADSIIVSKKNRN